MLIMRTLNALMNLLPGKKERPIEPKTSTTANVNLQAKKDKDKDNVPSPGNDN